jgi:hypothetical protein
MKTYRNEKKIKTFNCYYLSLLPMALIENYNDYNSKS